MVHFKSMSRRVFPVVMAIMLMSSGGRALAEVSAGSADGGIKPESKAVKRQDGRFIPRLEWVSPHGERPGTVAEYLKARPVRSARFADMQMLSAPGSGDRLRGMGDLSISVLVDSELYPSISSGLDLYTADLVAEGYSVYVETVAGGSAEDIKAWVAGRYAAGCTRVVFVGDITVAWAEVSGAVFPCDYYYMDVDGYWEDADGDGDYEIHNSGTGDEGPEVYVARIYAHTLKYDTEAKMVNGYFEKTHAFRKGLLTQPWRGLEYIDDDWFDMDVGLDLVYDENITRYDYGHLTTAADYLNQIDLGQHFVQVAAHSYSGGHHFGTRPSEAAVYAHTYVYSPTARNGQLLLGSDDGIKAWLNGSTICEHNVTQGWTADQFTENVALDQGWNRLLCKISQGGSKYQFSARFVDTNGVTFEDLSYQLNDPDVGGDEAQFIRSWLVNGFHQDIADNFWGYLTENYLGVNEAAINPQPGDVMGGNVWTVYDSSSAFVDLGIANGEANYGASYSFARVTSDTAKSCQLWVGYADGVRVWLNGVEVLYDNRYGSYEADMSKVDVTMQAGENRLLVKSSQWMGLHGFSARFAHADGSPVAGLSYDPASVPISYIESWLLSGPYVNPDYSSRLSQDYLGNETSVRPSEGDSSPAGDWEKSDGGGYPHDLGGHYDLGEWVFSQDIQERDPPVLFYNLFSCGSGRFTDENYLAGSYIFNTTYGLITVASAKTGSMLNFHDFTGPIGEGKTVGESYYEWFETQAPFEVWEREWYYGLILNGDPTLRPLRQGDFDRDGDVDSGDFAILGDCLTGPGGEAGSGCGPADIDGDGDIDLKDFAVFVGRFTGA